MITVAASSKHDPESTSKLASVKVVESPHPGLTSNPHPDLTSLPHPDLTSLLTTSNVAMPSNKTELIRSKLIRSKLIRSKLIRSCRRRPRAPQKKAAEKQEELRMAVMIAECERAGS